MTDIDRSLGKRWFEEVWNKGRREAIAEMMTPDVTIHDGGQETHGVEAFEKFFDRLRDTFSDMKVTVHDTLVDGDKMCIRWSVEAKHTGDGLGVPATGILTHATGISIGHVEDGKFRETWQNWDMLGMMEQIKVVPVAATYVASR